jgi:hypothetical protein
MKYMNSYKQKTMKKRILVLIAVMILSPVLIKAQNPNQERLNAYKIAFFTKRLNLTSREAEKFWPVYNEFQAKKMEIQRERVKLNIKFNQEGTTLSDEELTVLSDRYVELDVVEAELGMALHGQLKAILPPEKVIRLYQAENQYRQQLLNELQERKQQQGGNPNQQRPLQ